MCDDFNNSCLICPQDDQSQEGVSQDSQSKHPILKDYTEWQREHFDHMDLETLLAAAYAYEDAHPIGKRAKARQEG